jgi:hypothetical protein
MTRFATRRRVGETPDTLIAVRRVRSKWLCLLPAEQSSALWSPYRMQLPTSDSTESGSSAVSELEARYESSYTASQRLNLDQAAQRSCDER